MTVADLIAELQRMPNQAARVHVCLRRVTILSEGGDYIEHLSEEDSIEADEVRNAGPYVLVWSK